MKASDYIVQYIIKQGITDVFGYPGGMVTHLLESFSKYKDEISSHVTYNEQGAAMAACGYAQVSGKTGVAYATSGPGATNMITGICNAYMDSIPIVFITGQVNSFEQKGNLAVRQRGFQETDIVSMVKGVTKYAVQVNDVNDLKRELKYAFYIAKQGRKGPVLLDITMDVTKSEIEGTDFLDTFESETNTLVISDDEIENIMKLIKKAKRPVLLIGNGVQRNKKNVDNMFSIINNLNIPVVSSMIAVDIRGYIDRYYGFIGAYGDRVANFIVAKSDLIVSLGARLDVRQVGANRSNFAPNAKLIRIDIDQEELKYKVHDDEIDVCMDAICAVDTIFIRWSEYAISYEEWNCCCKQLEQKLSGIDENLPNTFIKNISRYIPKNAVITTDVGQNQVWVAQSFETKNGQQILFSGGHGAMGYSLPAAIGAAFARKGTVYSFNGDGGIQMNIQELQTIIRENLPIKIIIFNNNALGMIRHFQEMYFNGNYYQTTDCGGYSSPNFGRIAEAYGFEYIKINNLDDVSKIENVLQDSNPAIIEVQQFDDTYIFPKLEFGKPNQDQEPLLARTLYEQLMNL